MKIKLVTFILGMLLMPWVARASVTPDLHLTETAANGYGTTHITFRNLNTIQTVKASNATVYATKVINTQSNASAYIAFFDQPRANAITLGTTSPDLEIFCPPASDCYAPIPPTIGINFARGLFVASTTAEMGNVTSQSGVIIWIYYK